MATRTPLMIPAERLAGLRRFNLIAGVAHAVQAVAIVALAKDFGLPVTAQYLGGPPGSTAFERVSLFDIQLAWGIFAFFALSAVAHLWLVTPVGFRRYAAGLAQQQNVARWVEYGLSSSIMIFLIAQIVGISDIIALSAIFAVNAAMIMFGWLQEKYEVPGEGGMVPFVFGSMVGIVPWLAIVFLLVAPGSTSGAEPPAFVYGIIVSLFVFFNTFAVNQWLQYKQVGRWKDYLVGERAYITLSLVAKSLLAWQVFANTLAP
ncbi:MAG: heliorhodopsin HeR [Cellulomonas sp.]